jgi:hypothetical protein
MKYQDAVALLRSDLQDLGEAAVPNVDWTIKEQIYGNPVPCDGAGGEVGEQGELVLQLNDNGEMKGRAVAKSFLDALESLGYAVQILEESTNVGSASGIKSGFKIYIIWGRRTVNITGYTPCIR